MIRQIISGSSITKSLNHLFTKISSSNQSTALKLDAFTLLTIGKRNHYFRAQRTSRPHGSFIARKAAPRMDRNTRAIRSGITSPPINTVSGWDILTPRTINMLTGFRNFLDI